VILISHHILPLLGGTTLADLQPVAVREWHATLAERRPGVAPKAYRLLRQMLAQAVADRLIPTNPCAIARAASEQSAERPVASVDEVAGLAGAVPGRYRAMVLLAAWCAMRYDELAALTRENLDLGGWCLMRSVSWGLGVVDPRMSC